MDTLTHRTAIDPRHLALPPLDTAPAPARDDLVAALRGSGLDHEVDLVAETPAHTWPAATVRGGGFRLGHDRIDEQRHSLAWPDGLYIPRQADYRDFWFFEPPADHRYAQGWPTSADPVPDRGDPDTGEVFAYATVPFDRPGLSSGSEAGVGIRYSPAFTLGTIDVEPTVEVRDGMLTAALEYYPLISAGSVTLTASVGIGLWQVIPGGLDLVDLGLTPVARITRDQSYGATREPLPGSLYRPQSFTKRFLVEGARDYVIGVVGHIDIASTLTDDRSRPLTGLTNRTFTVYGWEKLRITSIQVQTRTVHQP